MPLKYFLINVMVFALALSKPLPAACTSVKLQPTPFPGRYGFFEVVKHFPDSNRVENARNLYKNTCRTLSPPEAMSRLDQLSSLARDIHDKNLECAVYDMRADYFSVNNGLNTKSTAYYKLALKFAEDNGMIIEEGVYLHRMAIYFSIYRQNTRAINYILRSLDIFRSVGYSRVPNMGLYMFQIADFYYSIEDLDNAQKYALEALHYKTNNIRLTINTINTVGLIYRDKRQFNKALSYFNDALATARQKKDSAWIGIATGNIGSVYFMQHQYAKALPYIVTDYNTSLKFNEKLNAGKALLRLIAINISENKFAEADKQLELADTFKGRKLSAPEFYMELYKLRAQYYELTGNLKRALTYRKIYEKTADSLKAQDSREAIERISLKWEQEKYQQRIAKMKNAEKARDMRRNVIIAFVVLLTIIIGLVYNRMLIKAKSESDFLKVENKRVDEELKNAGNELLHYTHSIEEKNSIINSFKKQLEQLNLQFADDKKAEELNKLLQTHIMTDASWNEFKRLFNRVYPGFFQRAKEKYSSISETDLRLMGLIRLELDNRTMAGMLGITPEGIKKARQRLRKKMSLAADISIEEIVFSV